MRKFQFFFFRISVLYQKSEILDRLTAVTSTQAYMITLAEVKGSGVSFVHEAPNQKTDTSQKRVDFLSTQMSVDLFSTLDTCYF